MDKFSRACGLSGLSRRRFVFERAIRPVLSRFHIEPLERRVMLSTALPTVLSAALDQGGPSQRLLFHFSENVSGSLSPADLLVRDQSTGQALSASELSLSYDAGSNTAAFSFAGVSGAVLPDGRYSATLLAADIADASGNHLDGSGAGVPGSNYTLHFFTLTGDVNNDAKVNFTDLVTLAANYNKTSATYSRGDLNRDGKVNFSDLVILAANYNRTLSAAPQVTAALAHDTGLSSTDGITMDPTVSGQIAQASGTKLLAAVDGPPVSYTDVTAQVVSDSP